MTRPTTSTMTLTLQRVTPDAVPTEVPLRRLLAAWEQRAHAAARGSQDGAGAGGHALTALALGAAIVERLQAMRWAHVEIALLQGATVQAAADALGLDVEELRVGYGMHVERREVAGVISPLSAARLRQLVDDGPR